MFELLFCATLTVLPDYLIRRYVQGKRIGHEITLFSVWYVLRYGLTACVMLTVALITVIFYYHPTATNVQSFFRTVTILPEGAGRVAEVRVENGQTVEAGDVIFTLDDSTQRAAEETAERRIAEVQAGFALAEKELDAAIGQVDQATGALKQAQDELDVRMRLLAEGSPAANRREVERMQNTVASRQGALDAALAQKEAVEARIDTLLPAQLATAEAALQEARAALEKTVVRAGVTGEVQQFALQPGDIVNPVLRPAGILVPKAFFAETFVAGFGQVSAQVLKEGMIAEMTCASLPFTIVPMQITSVQDFLPAGQFRPSDRLMDIQERAQPGMIMVQMEPLFDGGTDGIPRGSRCVANAYTSNHEKLATEDLGFGTFLFLHMVDTVGLVHALILRVQALLLPVKTLVLTGH